MTELDVSPNQVGNSVRVRFPEAGEVFLVGEFNQWSTAATPMRNIGDGVWEVTLPMGTSLGRFCFYVLANGQARGHIEHHEVEFEPVAG